MTVMPNIKSVQDLPPNGGYPEVPFRRAIGNRGPPGWAIWAAILGFSAFGFFRLSQTNEDRRLALKEKREARMAVWPYLQYEKDRIALSKVEDALAKEKEIMKNREDWVVGESVYHHRWSLPVLAKKF